MYRIWQVNFKDGINYKHLKQVNESSENPEAMQFQNKKTEETSSLNVEICQEEELLLKTVHSTIYSNAPYKI